jgi:two-component system sensor histidine kinase UhpB
MVNELQKKGELKDYELILKTKKGEKKYVSINARLIFDDLGIPHHIDGAIRDISERKIAESELIKAHEQLKLLFRHQENIRENERTKISREIHDELGQSLSALKVDVGWARDNVSDNPTVVNKLNNMFGTISDTIENVQRISAELRPGLLDDLGLIPAMEWYCEEFEKRTNIKCSLISADILISNNSKILSLYRVLQEALTNVMRHANASKVHVHIYIENDSIILKIKDNGMGIASEKVDSGKSLGIIGLRERANQFNGNLRINSEKGKGAELIFEIPVDKNDITD